MSSAYWARQKVQVAPFYHPVEAYDVWYYEDLEATGSKADVASNSINLEFKQQILLVYFKGDKFDGYLWTSNKGAAKTD